MNDLLVMNAICFLSFVQILIYIISLFKKNIAGSTSLRNMYYTSILAHRKAFFIFNTEACLKFSWSISENSFSPVLNIVNMAKKLIYFIFFWQNIFTIRLTKTFTSRSAFQIKRKKAKVINQTYKKESFGLNSHDSLAGHISSFVYNSRKIGELENTMIFLWILSSYT